MTLHKVHQEILSDEIEKIYGFRCDNGEFADLTFEEYRRLLEYLEFERDVHEMI